jgi:cytochrome c553
VTVTTILQREWRSPALWLVIAAFCLLAIGIRAASAQPMPLAERIKQCATCHGEDGNSRIEKIPSLAGQPEFFILNQLFLMREGVRRIEAMQPFVKDLKDEDLQALATHFSKLAAKASEEKVDPELVKRGAALSERLRCASCHLPTLAGQEQMPRLARQRIDYMVDAMKSYRDNKRQGADTAMTAVIVGISDADLTALAHYAAQR